MKTLLFLFSFILLFFLFLLCLDQDNLLFLNHRSLASVSYAAVDFFRPSAQRLIEEKGAVDALAAALAHISGASSFEPRSLITSDTVESYERIVCGWEKIKMELLQILYSDLLSVELSPFHKTLFAVLEIGFRFSPAHQ